MNASAPFRTLVVNSSGMIAIGISGIPRMWNADLCRTPAEVDILNYPAVCLLSALVSLEVKGVQICCKIDLANALPIGSHQAV